jgi:hypothetical protein
VSLLFRRVDDALDFQLYSAIQVYCDK